MGRSDTDWTTWIVNKIFLRSFIMVSVTFDPICSGFWLTVDKINCKVHWFQIVVFLRFAWITIFYDFDMSISRRGFYCNLSPKIINSISISNTIINLTHKNGINRYSKVTLRKQNLCFLLLKRFCNALLLIILIIETIL